MDWKRYKKILTADDFAKKYQLAVSRHNTYTLEDFNQWLADQRCDFIDFERYDFEKNYELFSRCADRVSFRGVIFPNCDIRFDYATFGKGEVSFDYATFGEGNVSFYGATFGEGNVSFEDATFLKGDVSFDYATFGEGYVFFDYATFGEGNVSFEDATFLKGSVYFKDTDFGEGYVSFRRATFGEGDVSFLRTTFGVGVIFIQPYYFYKGVVSFDGVRCEGRMFLSGISGLNGKVAITSSEFSGGFKLSNTVDGSINNNHRKPKPLLESVSFDSTRFDKGLILEGIYNCPVDLRNTHINGHFSLDNVDIELQRTGPFYKRVSISDQSAGRFRRLKDLADQARNKELSLKFHASELRSLRWHHQGVVASTLDMLYSGLCDYGRSIARPLIALCVLGILCAFYYSGWSFEKIKPAADLSIANAFPYLSKKQAEESLKALCNGLEDGFVYTLVRVGQGIGTSILLFLTGLGLRNRFRV